MFWQLGKAKKGLKYYKKGRKKGLSVDIIILIVGLVALAVGVALGFYDSVKGKRYRKKGVTVYLVVFAVIFLLFGLTAFISKEQPSLIYTLLGLGFAILGAIHTWLMYLSHSWSERKSLIPEMLFTFYVLLVGAIPFAIFYYFFDKEGYRFEYNLVLLSFPIPFFILKAWDLFCGVPTREISGWKFPQGRLVNVAAYDPELLQRRESWIIYLLFSNNSFDNKRLDEAELRVSPDYHFGEFFQVFVGERNRSGLNRIEYLSKDPTDREISWVFYVKPRFWWQFKRYIDPDKTVYENGLQRGDTIVGLRIYGDSSSLRDIREPQVDYRDGLRRGGQTNNSNNSRFTNPQSGSSSGSSIKIRKR